MNPSLDHEIRDKLGSYLLGEFSLEDFKDWFVPVSWDVDHGNNQAAIKMVYEIELRLAEYSDGYWSEDELKNLLRPLVENYWVELAPICEFQLGSNVLVDHWLLSPVSFHKLSSGASL